MRLYQPTISSLNEGLLSEEKQSEMGEALAYGILEPQRRASLGREAIVVR